MTTPGQSSGPQSSGLAPNVASLLCYVCSFVSGLIFLLIEKQNKEVQFHAWQAIFFGISAFVVQIGLSILSYVLGAIAGFLGGLVSMLSPLVGIVFLVFWIICMVKAYQGEHYKLPVLGDLAEKQVHR